MPHTLAIALTAAAGLTAGAFLVRPAVFAHTTDEGLRTSCPTCNNPLLRAGTAPYLQLVLHRRCARCAARPAVAVLGATASGPAVAGDARPGAVGPLPLVPEALTALALAGVVAGGADGWLLAAQLWLALVGSALVLIDLAVKRLPDLLTAAAAIGAAALLGAAAVAGGEWAALGRAAAAAAVVGAVFVLLALFAGLGLGDVKVAPTLAGLLGWHSWTAVYWGIAAGFLLALLHGVVLMLAGQRRGTDIAFGPALLIGAVAASVTIG
ncbi:prepilin peptidase [Kitasatospora sp. NPDC057223]|uniref:prepilin peptidase n=1 Tax=Kitasatospora sp. NPDC057223 TaxID=3346055 RepID=UPI0036271FB0